MADHRCWRCRFRKNAGTADSLNKVRCVPEMKTGGRLPFWSVYAPQDVYKWRDLDESETRSSDRCARFDEVPEKIDLRKKVTLGSPLRSPDEVKRGSSR